MGKKQISIKEQREKKKLKIVPEQGRVMVPQLPEVALKALQVLCGVPEYPEPQVPVACNPTWVLAQLAFPVVVSTGQ